MGDSRSQRQSRHILDPLRCSRAPKTVLLLSLLLLALAAIPAASASATETGLVTDITWGSSRSEVDQTVSLLKDSGTHWIRANLPWNAIEEAGKGVYNTAYLSNVDYAVEQARAAGIEVEMPIADGVPYWASADPNKYQDASGYHYNRFYRPTSFQDYADFVEWAANRYKGMGVHVYEVWNEPDNPAFWPSGPNAAAYAEMLKAAYPAIKRADPAATVLMGGLSKNDYPFLQAMYEAGAASYFDAVNVHPYAGSVDPTMCWKQSGTTTNAIDAFCGVEAVYETMQRNGDGAKKLWLTEFGYSTCSGTYCVSEAQQAEYLTKAYQRAASWPYVQTLFWYQLRNWGSSSGEWTDNLGLVTSSFVEKPAYAAFKAYATAKATASEGGSAVPPTVQLTSPAGGSAFTSKLSFAADAADAHGIAKVELVVDGRVIHTSTTAPYAYSWSVPKKLSYGTHTVQAIAFDTIGLSASASATVTRVKSSSIALSVTSATASSARARHHGAQPRSHKKLVKGRVFGAGTSSRRAVVVRLSRLLRHRWVPVRTWRLRLNAAGRFDTVVVPRRRGRWRIRATYRARGRVLSSPFRYFHIA